MSWDSALEAPRNLPRKASCKSVQSAGGWTAYLQLMTDVWNGFSTVCAQVKFFLIQYTAWLA